MRILPRNEQIKHMLSCLGISFARHGHSCLTIAIERVCNGAVPGQVLYEEIAEIDRDFNCRMNCCNLLEKAL